MSQKGLADEQVELSMHSTHSPVVEQAVRSGYAPLHWLGDVHGVQVCVVGLQMGTRLAQLELARHCTHLFAATSQTDVAPVQVELSTHSTHAPVAEHAVFAGSKAAHSFPVVHPRQV